MGPASPPLAPPPQGSCLSCLQLVLSYLLAVTQALGLPRAQGPLLGSSPARAWPGSQRNGPNVSEARLTCAGA